MDDTEIAIMIMDRQEEGLRLLLDLHGSKVKSYLEKKFASALSWDEIDEALYQAADNVWRKIDQYDETKARLGAWFLRIAHNCAVNIIRRESKFEEYRANFEEGLTVPLTIEVSVENPTFDRKVKKAMKLAIDSLPPMQKSIIEADLMTEDGNASAARLAEMHGTTAGSIRVSRNKAKEKLKKSLEDAIENPREKKMTTERDRKWNVLTDQLRKEGKLTPLSAEEAEKEYEAASDSPLSYDQKETIIQRVLKKSPAKTKLPTPPIQPSEFLPIPAATSAEFCQLNRNKGGRRGKRSRTFIEEN